MNPINNYRTPHALDRKDQLSTIESILASRSKYIIVDAPTGSGKTAWAAYASSYGRVMSLVETKSLQSQYSDGYGFDLSLGRGNFQCGEINVSAELCPNTRCNADCEYKVSRMVSLQSPRTISNYTKCILDRRLADGHNTDILFLDEAHRLPHIVRDNSGIEIPWNHKFIQLASRSIPAGNSPVSRNHGIKALKDMINAMRDNEVDWMEGEPKTRDRLSWERMNMRLRSTLSYIKATENPQAWFYDGTDNTKMIIRPLTAMYNFPLMFDTASKIVLMSATIGNPQVLARRLGIDNYEYISIDGEFSPDMRPVYELPAPKISFRSTEADYIQQAKVINNALNLLPSHWTGILHTKSKKHAYKLQSIFNSLPDTSFHFLVMPRDIRGTEKQLEWWKKNREPGTILIHWAFWEGVDLGDDNISITCKAPFPFSGDPYGKAMLAYDRDGYSQSTACDIEQSCGRPRRGHDSHYGPDAEKFIAIADMNYIRVKSSFSNSFRNSIVKWDVDKFQADNSNNYSQVSVLDLDDAYIDEIPF